MENLNVKIGEHIVTVISKSEKMLGWVKKNFGVINFSTHRISSPDLFIYIKEGYGVPFENFNVEISSVSCGVVYKRADYLLEVNHDYSEAVISIYNELSLKHALNNLYSSFIVHKRWGLLIHSSCVVHGNKAQLFAGQSGAGKSTIARLSYPKPILSDEATIVKINEDEITVFDSPFRSELSSSFQQRPCSLASIYLLIQSLDVRISPVRKSDALLGVIDKVFYWHHDSSETSKLLKMCKTLVEKVPIYSLYFQKDPTFWELIS